MNWLFWRMYRKQIIFTGLAVLAYAAILFLVGNHVADQYAQAKNEHRLDTFFLSNFVQDFPLTSMAVPLLLGMFWGAPLFAKELAEGTHKFAWTQATSRRRWLFVKLGWAVGFAALFGALTSAAVMWCSRTQNAMQFSQFEVLHFNTQGIVPIAYAIFAIALGAFIGAYFRSVLRSVAITMATFVVVMLCIANFVRPHYMSPRVAGPDESLEPKINLQTHEIEPGAGTVWILRHEYKQVSGECHMEQGVKNCSSVMQSVKTVYQPADRYWKFQFIEFGLYLVLSAMLAGATYRLVQKRDA